MAVLGYMLTTGRHPFRGQNSAETVRNIYSPEPAPPPSSFMPDYPKALEAALLRALEKQPEDRFQSAHDFLSALEDVAPEYLENSFEVKLGAYMRELFGARQAERRRQLRLAEENASGSSSGMMLATTSNGSLGAVSIDGGRATGSSASMRFPVGAEPGSGSLPTGIAQPPRRVKWVALPVASLTLVAAGFFLSRMLSDHGAATQKSAAARAVPEASVVASEPAAPMVELSARSLPSAPPESAEPATSASSTPRARGRRVAPVAAAQKSAPAATSVAASAPAAAPSPPAAPANAPTNNSWDRSTFGGRY
ncbi:MAG: hypothetical protein QM756_03580 [Polyangiaceae bacterium]